MNLRGVVYTFSEDQGFCGMALPTPLPRILNITLPKSPGLVPGFSPSPVSWPDT